MALYHRYRPKDFDEFVGNEQVVECVQSLLNKKKKPHVFLFTGPSGCGKTTLARIIAKHLKCYGSDFHEIDSGQFSGIDTSREIRRKVFFKPLQSDVSVWVLDECHKMSQDAQNALLKILEDTPKHVFFILATTDPQKILKTVKSRCSIFQMAPLKENEINQLLSEIAEAENCEVTDKELELIYDKAQGHPRESIQLLEQILDLPDKKQRSKFLSSLEQTQHKAIELCQNLYQNGSWKKTSSILVDLKNQNEDPESLRRMILSYCATTLLSGKDNVIAGLIMENMIEPFYNTGFEGLVFACYSIHHSTE